MEPAAPNSDPISVSAPELDLAPIEKRAAAATPGPWSADIDHDYFNDGTGEVRCMGVNGPASDRIVITDCGCYPPAPADATFIAACRTDVPALVAEVRRLRDRAAALERGQDVAVAALAEVAEALIDAEVAFVHLRELTS